MVVNRLWVSVSLAVLLVGCGYPVDPDKWVPDFGIEGDHGAIAINAEDMSGALTARFLSQEEADARALGMCGAGCEIVLRFEGGDACGALASASDGRYGAAEGRVKAATESAAIEQCSLAGGNDCQVQLSGCNS